MDDSGQGKKPLSTDDVHLGAAPVPTLVRTNTQPAGDFAQHLPRGGVGIHRSLDERGGNGSAGRFVTFSNARESVAGGGGAEGGGAVGGAARSEDPSSTFSRAPVVFLQQNAPPGMGPSITHSAASSGHGPAPLSHSGYGSRPALADGGTNPAAGQMPPLHQHQQQRIHTSSMVVPAVTPVQSARSVDGQGSHVEPGDSASNSPGLAGVPPSPSPPLGPAIDSLNAVPRHNLDHSASLGAQPYGSAGGAHGRFESDRGLKTLASAPQLRARAPRPQSMIIPAVHVQEPVWPARIKVVSFFIAIFGLLLAVWSCAQVVWNGIIIGILAFGIGLLGWHAAAKRSIREARAHWWLLVLYTMLSSLFNIILGARAMRNGGICKRNDCENNTETFWLIIWISFLVTEFLCNTGCAICAKAHHRELILHKYQLSLGSPPVPETQAVAMPLRV